MDNSITPSRTAQPQCILLTDLPAIILTAIDEEETVIKGIERFAEDYVVKPFSPRELVARVHRILRRIGDFTYALAPVTQVDDRLAADFLLHRLRQKIEPGPNRPIYVLTARGSGYTFRKYQS